MVALAELAKKYRIKKNTLAVRLWEARIEATSYRMGPNKRFVKEYDAATCKRVAALLKAHPVRRRRGRPTKRRKN